MEFIWCRQFFDKKRRKAVLVKLYCIRRDTIFLVNELLGKWHKKTEGWKLSKIGSKKWNLIQNRGLKHIFILWNSYQNYYQWVSNANAVWIIVHLCSFQVHRLVVVDEHDKILGIISLSDILRFLVIDPPKLNIHQ